MKPYYADDRVSIFHGDCLSLREVWPDMDSALVTDPPYGIRQHTAHTRFKNTAKGNDFAPVVGDDSEFGPEPFLGFRWCLFFGYNNFAHRLPPGEIYVWDKRFPNGVALLADAEIAWVKPRYAKPGPHAGGRAVYLYSETWQGFVAKQTRVHPTQKPEGLMSWAIQKMRLPKDATVFDPFMGSGTTLRAAKNLGHKAIGIEIEERYCEVAAKRMRQECLFAGVG